jgi:hypothetical protein
MTATLDRPALLGKETPRLATAPLRDLSDPRASLGHEAIAFAEDVLGVQLLAWQRWWLLHALELNEDGTYRFRTILTLVGRQQGKTTLLKIVALWAMFMERAHLVLGAAQSLDIARESWQGAVELAEGNPDLLAEVATVRKANGEQTLTLANGARYRISAATRSAGRGLSVDLLILDELREHRDWAAWGALSKTTIARPNALTVGISNAGDDQSAVLTSLRQAALADTDPSLALFEWSAPDGCALDDRDAWAQSMPGLGRTITEAAVRTALATDPPAVFRTELLCQHVQSVDGAIDPAAWRSCADPSSFTTRPTGPISLCLDVSLDLQHVTLAAASPLPDGRLRVEILDAWSSTDAARDAIPGIAELVQPAAFGWFPDGPAAALGAELRSVRRIVRLPIARIVSGELVEQEEHEAARLTGASAKEACQSFADLVASRRIVHPADPLLDAHVGAAGKKQIGDGWVMVRQGVGHVDAAYAAAGAVYLARMTPPEPPQPKAMIF